MNWNMVWIQQERYKDLLREAERERLVRLALAARPEKAARRNGLLLGVMGWLGCLLVCWGEWLQRHSNPCTCCHSDPDLKAPQVQVL